MAQAMTRSEVRDYADINMTPLIDVMLVLLIIFILTIPVQTHAIKIDTPHPSPTPPLPAQIIELAIDFDGAMSWNSQPVDRAALRRRAGESARRYWTRTT